ncbi:hypothetical protein D3C86_1561960 [compost metagenome]
MGFKVFSIDENFAFIWVDQSANELRNRRFPASGFSHYRKRFPSIYFKTKIINRFDSCIWISVTHVSEFDFARYWIGFRIGIDDVGFHVQKLIHTLHTCVRALIDRCYPTQHRERENQHIDVHKEICNRPNTHFASNIFLPTDVENRHIQKSNYEKDNREKVSFGFC